MKKIFTVVVSIFILLSVMSISTPVMAQSCSDPQVQCSSLTCSGSCVSCSKTVYYACDPLYPAGAQCSCQASTTCCNNGSCTVCDTNGACYTNGCPGTDPGGGTPDPTPASACQQMYYCNATTGSCSATSSTYEPTGSYPACGASSPTCAQNLASYVAGTTGVCYASAAACDAACNPPTPIIPPNTCVTMYYCNRGSWTCSATSSTYDSSTKVQCGGGPTCAQNLADWIPNTTGACYTSAVGCDNACNPPATSTPTRTPTPIPTATPSPTPIPVGTIRVRSVLVPSDTSTCAAVDASTSYISDSVTMTPPGTTLAIPSSGAYATWNNTITGTHSFSSNPGAQYTMKLACWTSDSPAAQGSGYSATLADNATLTWNLGYSLGSPWFQSQGGDVYAASSLQSYISSLAVSGQYFNTVGAGGTPGIVTYGTSYDFDSSADSGSTYVSSRNWLVNESQSSTDYYALLYHRFDSPPADYTGVTSLTTKLASRETPYYVDGNLSIDSTDWTVGNGETIVVFVNGSLTINKKITITGTGFVSFIVNGDISVDTLVGTTATSSTPVLEGIYITSPIGTFHTGLSTTAASRRFVGEGTFVAGNFALERDLDADTQNPYYSAELFVYNPELMIHMPEKMKDLPVAWQEVAP